MQLLVQLVYHSRKIRVMDIKRNCAASHALLYRYASEPFVNAVVEAVGWGTTFYGGSISTTLRKVSLNTISNAACSSYYGNIAATQICVKTPSKDTCQV